MQEFPLRVVSMSSAALGREGPAGKTPAVVIPDTLPAPGLLKFMKIP